MAKDMKIHNKTSMLLAVALGFLVLSVTTSCYRQWHDVYEPYPDKYNRPLVKAEPKIIEKPLLESDALAEACRADAEARADTEERAQASRSRVEARARAEADAQTEVDRPRNYYNYFGRFLD
jgi:hypothetical protein